MFTPSDTKRQTISEITEEISYAPQYNTSADYFGNRKVYGHIEEPHTSFFVKICGKAQTGLDIYEEYTEDEPFRYALLKAQTELTAPGETLRAYHKQLFLDTIDGVYDKTLHIMRKLHETYRYLSGSTEVHESAETAFALGEGVCQDYSHIMLSLLRMENIACRYVVGMMIGEGRSHAWVEVLCNGYWYGFDPTNNKLVDDEYIRVSCGRDSSDCSIIRGFFYGCANQIQSEKVTVEEEKE